MRCSRRCAGRASTPRRRDLGDAGVGERRRRSERRRRARRAAFATFARAAAERYPVGATMDRLERAEPAPLAEPSVADHLRHAAPQPGRGRDQGRDPERSDRRRVDGAARRPRRRVAGRVHPRAWGGRGRGSTPTRTIRTRSRRRRRRRPAAATRCTTISLATLERLLDETRKAFGPRTRIWLTELGFQTNPPDRILGVSWVRRRGRSPRRSTGRTRRAVSTS